MFLFVTLSITQLRKIDPMLSAITLSLTFCMNVLSVAFFIIMLDIILLSIVMLNDVMLSVVVQFKAAFNPEKGMDQLYLERWFLMGVFLAFHQDHLFPSL